VILGFAIIFIVLIFLISILLQRQDLRNRFVRLAGSADIQRTTAALDEAGGRLSKLFQTQLALNAAFGVAIGVGLQLTALGAGHLIRNAPNVAFFTSGQGPPP
jgi:predicted PurR-regulated permease PerM